MELRTKAVAKFGADAHRLYFTRDALEQATRARVADHRAARASLTGLDSVIDLGCGIGADLMAFAKAGLTAAGVDLDAVRVAMARANLAALDLPGAVSVADATLVDVSGFGLAYADPARRSGKGRTFSPEGWRPSWSFVEQLLQGPAAIKTAPGLPHAMVPGGAEAEWVSDGGDLKEAVIWSSPIASCERRATVLGDGGLASITEEDDPWFGAEERPVRALGAYLYEPDDAVIRAGLVTAVGSGVSGGLLDPKIAYLTSDEAFRTPFARGYRVVEVLPYREKSLKAALRARNIGSLQIKKRGVEVIPEALRKRLQLRGDLDATLLLTRAGRDTLALLVESF